MTLVKPLIKKQNTIQILFSNCFAFPDMFNNTIFFEQLEINYHKFQVAIYNLELFWDEKYNNNNNKLPLKYNYF